MRRIFQYVFSLSCLTAALMSQNSLQAQEIVPLPGSEAASVQLPMFHSGWFGLTDGVLKGTAVAISKNGEEAIAAGAKVTLLETSGATRNATADANGLFTFSGVQPGNYRLQVESETGFSSFAFRTVTMVGAETAIAKAYISTLSRAQAEDVFQAAWSPDLSTSSAGAPVGSKLVPQSLANQTPRVKMKDGLVYGELMFENSSANPSNHVVKVFNADGALITTERVDSLGKFSFAPKSAGVFNVVVGGYERACIPVIVVGQNGLSSLSNGTKFVSFNQPPAADSLVIPVLGPTDPPPSDNPPIAEVNDEAIIPLGLPPALPVGPGGGFAGGGGGGFGGGGAGGGGGGFGGGGALGLAGIALGAVALADDDGFNANAASLIAP